MLSTSVLLASLDLADREYWFGRCEGFRVRLGDRRLGVVDHVHYGVDPHLPDTVHVCAGFVRMREIAVPVDDVEGIDPRTRTLWVREGDRSTLRTPRQLPERLRRAGARARWAVQRG
jgi:hypothetical protein